MLTVVEQKVHASVAATLMWSVGAHSLVNMFFFDNFFKYLQWGIYVTMVSPVLWRVMVELWKYQPDEHSIHPHLFHMPNELRGT